MSAVLVTELVDEACFVLTIPRHLELDDVQVYLNRMEQALERGQPFGAIFAWADGRPRKSRHANRAEHDWLARHRSRVSEMTFGIAMISTPSLAGALPRLAMKAAGPRMFGCPCTVVPDTASALSWLRDRRDRPIVGGQSQ